MVVGGGSPTQTGASGCFCLFHHGLTWGLFTSVRVHTCYYVRLRFCVSELGKAASGRPLIPKHTLWQ